MSEKALIPRAQVVQSGLAIRCQQEAVLRTLAVAHLPDLAIPAELRQSIELGLSECPLCRMFEQRPQRRFPNIPQAMLPIHIMVAAEEISIVLDDRNIAAGRPEKA